MNFSRVKVSFSADLIGSGTTPLSNNANYYEKGSINWLMTGDLNDGDILNTRRKITLNALDQYPTLRQYPKNCLVIAMYGATIGKLGLLKISSTVNQAACVIQFSETHDPKFWFYLFLSKREFILSLSCGGGQPNISKETVKSLRFNVPNLIKDQILISKYLDKKTEMIDSLIKKIETKIELLKEQKTILINQLVTKGLDQNAEMKDSGIEWIGIIPKPWEVKKFSWVCFFQEGPGLRNWQFVDKGIPVVCVTNITPEGLNFEKYKRNISSEEYLKIYKHFTVQDNDLLLASSGNSFGKICQYQGEFNFKFILNTSTIRIHSLDEEIIKTKYIKFVIQSDVFQNQIKVLITGSAQPNFGPTHLNQVKISVPSIKEQEEIILILENRLEITSKLIFNQEKKITLLNEYRQSLISSVVTGKIPITEDML